MKRYLVTIKRTFEYYAENEDDLEKQLENDLISEIQYHGIQLWFNSAEWYENEMEKNNEACLTH